MLEPNMNDMLDHIYRLHGWAIDSEFSKHRFEIRCLRSDDAGSVSERFRLDQIAAAVSFAVEKNRDGWNVYVTSALLDPSCNRTCRDGDVRLLRWHFVEADENDLDELLREIDALNLRPNFVVLTGTTPRPRLHVYWRLDEAVDPIAWRTVQAGLAARLKTDDSVINPSRLLRLAGSASYPKASKRDRGYITEVTAFQSMEDYEASAAAFQTAFPASQKALETVAPVAWSTQPGSDEVPLAVVRAALGAIPVITRRGGAERRLWVSLAFACLAIGEHGWAAFDEWQRQSPLYHPGTDDRLRYSLRNPEGPVTLFARARDNDPDWWRHDDEVANWWRARAASQQSPLERLNNKINWKLSHKYR